MTEQLVRAGLIAAGLLLFQCHTAVAAGNLLANGEFERSFGSEGIAEGWADNSSWANLDVRYGRETKNPHSGRTCQRIMCTRLTYGAVQMVPTKRVSLRRGSIYRVRVWLRGNVGQVAVQLRQAPAPYRIYVEESLTTKAQWQEASYLWTSTVEDRDGRFMLRFTQTGSMWVDDASVEELSAEEAARTVPPPVSGNLLHNGGFDLGLANWLVSHGCDYWTEPALSVEKTGDGPCLKVVVPEGVGVVLSSDVVSVTAGHPIAVSCRVRAAAATRITFGSDYCQTSVKVSETWQTLKATGTVGFNPHMSDHVRFHITGPATLWVDEVQLRQDGQARGADRPHAAIVSDRHPLSLYHDGEEPMLRLMSTVPPAASSTEFAWQVENFWGKLVLLGKWQPGPFRKQKSISCRKLPRGWYRAVITWRDEDHQRRDESTFCLLPPTERTGTVGESPFGAHFAVDPSGMGLAKAVGVRWLRLHPPNHTKWRIVEPKQGEWRWRDEALTIAREAGFELCGSLHLCPVWASTAPSGTPDYFYTGFAAWMPRKWEEWETYVAETVRRYRKDIHVWEVWNEPNLTDWLVPRQGQTRAQAYLELLQHTYPVVKRENPEATVIGACVAGALVRESEAERFALDLLNLGALRLMDVFSFHEYITHSVDEGDDPIAAWVTRFHERMRAAGREVPIINSEGGYANPGASITYRPCPGGTVPPDKMARWLVRQYVAQLAVGIRRFFFYNFFINGSPITRDWEGFVEGDGQPRPSVAAYATMTWLLDGASFQHSEHPVSNVWAHYFSTPRGLLAVVWSRTGTTAPVRFERALCAWDLMGAPIAVPASRKLRVTDAPIYALLKP